jgi:hypothetical protein
MKTYSRLHLHGHSGPNTRGYIVADPVALRALAKCLQNAANSPAGFEVAKFYGSDGHEYELVIACDVSEEEWQDIPLPNDKKSDPAKTKIVQLYDELRTN